VGWGRLVSMVMVVDREDDTGKLGLFKILVVLQSIPLHNTVYDLGENDS
jgi:hypothetical protein